MVLMLWGVKSATPYWIRTIDVLEDCSASCTIGLTHNREKLCVPDVEQHIGLPLSQSQGRVGTIQLLNQCPRSTTSVLSKAGRVIFLSFFRKSQFVIPIHIPQAYPYIVWCKIPKMTQKNENIPTFSDIIYVVIKNITLLLFPCIIPWLFL